MNLLTVAEIAERLNAPPRTVRYWCERGYLKAQKVGRDWVALESALEGFKPPRRGRPRKVEE